MFRLLLPLLFVVRVLAADPSATGAVQGRVSNQGTGTYLEAAVVTLVGSDTSVRTDRDGSYAFSQLAPGPVALKVSYPGLDDVSVTVEVQSGSVTTHDFNLTSAVYVLDTVVVSTTREGNAAAIARQESALTVSSSVAMDAYGNVAKGDLGSFLQRLPGVVGEYGGSAVDAVSVRGLSPQFTTVNEDGTRVASANPGARTQQVSAIPVNSIESIEVIKTPTADMSADSLGGVVNIRTRSAFDNSSRSLVLNASTTFNETMRGNLDPRGEASQLYPNFSAQYSDVFMLGGRKLGVSLDGGYSKIGDGLQTVRTQLASDWDYSSPSLPRRVLYADHEFHTNTRSSLNSKFDYKLSDDASVSFRVSYSTFRNVMEQIRPQYSDSVTLDRTATTEDYWVFSRARYRMGHNFRDFKNTTWKYDLRGKANVGSVKLNWGFSYSDSDRPQERMDGQARSANNFGFIYDRRTSKEFPTLTFTTGVPPPNDTFSNLSQMSLGVFSEHATNQIKNAKFDATKKFDWRWPVTFKTGFNVRQEDRSTDSDVLNISYAGGDRSSYRLFEFTHGWVNGRYPATPLVDTLKLYRDAGIAYVSGGNPSRPALKYTYNSSVSPDVTGSVAGSLSGDSQTREIIPAGFVQGVVELRKNLTMTAGLRAEQSRTKLTTPSDLGDAVATPEERYGENKTVRADYMDWFPNLQFRYEPIKHLVARANFSTTIGRPELAYLIQPFTVIELETGELGIQFANPGLRPQYSRNIDLSVEYYFKPIGVVSVGVFRKDLTDFVVDTLFTVVGDELGLDLSQYVGSIGRTKMNAGKGQVEGLEFNYSYQFSYLPGPWQGLGMMANWTTLRSSGDYNGLVSVPLPFSNDLIGMRPNSGNIGVSYNYRRWDLRAMWNYNSSYLSGLNTADPSSSSFFGEREQWDFFARFKINEKFNVFLDVINVLEENRAIYQGQVSPSRQVQTNLFPRTITAGIQARF